MLRTARTVVKFINHVGGHSLRSLTNLSPHAISGTVVGSQHGLASDIRGEALSIWRPLDCPDFLAQPRNSFPSQYTAHTTSALW